MAEAIFEDIMVKNFTKLLKNNADTNSESPVNPSKRGTNKITFRHNTAKLLRLQRQRENILGSQKSDYIQRSNT